MTDTTFDDSTTDSRSSYIDRDRYGMYAGDGDQGPGPRLMGADTLLGNDVYNRQDEDLGDIKEIMLDMQSGQVAYAVLSYGGFLGMGEKLFAVPWQALTLDTANHRFTLDVDKERLKDAPGFDTDHWPDMADQNWADGVHSFYGTSASDPSPRTGTVGTYDDVSASTGAYDATGLSATGAAAQPNDRVPTNRSGTTPTSIPID